jgi:hypothetical protein
MGYARSWIRLQVGLLGIFALGARAAVLRLAVRGWKPSFDASAYWLPPSFRPPVLMNRAMATRLALQCHRQDVK